MNEGWAIMSKGGRLYDFRRTRSASIKAFCKGSHYPSESQSKVWRNVWRRKFGYSCVRVCLIAR